MCKPTTKSKPAKEVKWPAKRREGEDGNEEENVGEDEDMEEDEPEPEPETGKKTGKLVSKRASVSYMLQRHSNLT